MLKRSRFLKQLSLFMLRKQTKSSRAKKPLPQVSIYLTVKFQFQRDLMLIASFTVDYQCPLAFMTIDTSYLTQNEWITVEFKKGFRYQGCRTVQVSISLFDEMPRFFSYSSSSCYFQGLLKSQNSYLQPLNFVSSSTWFNKSLTSSSLAPFLFLVLKLSQLKSDLFTSRIGREDNVGQTGFGMQLGSIGALYSFYCTFQLAVSLALTQGIYIFPKDASLFSSPKFSRFLQLGSTFCIILAVSYLVYLSFLQTSFF